MRPRCGVTSTLDCIACSTNQSAQQLNTELHLGHRLYRPLLAYGVRPNYEQRLGLTRALPSMWSVEIKL